ncbi:MAG: type II toxin-antitoxin system RelE/ParE family toxin [Acidobacteriaceae bacterium]
MKGNEMPAEVFLLKQPIQHQARLSVLFEKLSDHGQISNREQFKKLTRELWEFKAFQIRMPCYFRPDRRVVVTHGFIKKKDRVDKQELTRAEAIRNEYERSLIQRGKG